MSRYKECERYNEDKQKLFIREWLPDKAPKAMILYIHGLGSHSGRLGHWAERFTAEDVGFIAYDQRGHGISDGKRGQPEHIDRLIEDVDFILKNKRESHPGIPFVIYGHSMGGNVAINYVIRNPEKGDGLIAASPWLELSNPPSKTLVSILQPLVKLLPGLAISNGLNAKDISRDADEVAKYKNDPLVHGKISIGLFNSVRKSGLQALENASAIKQPFLLMHGTADPITSPEASKTFFSVSSGSGKLKLWEGAFHELHHELQRKEVHSFIMDWLNENIVK